MADEMNGEREALGLSLEQRGGVWVVQFAEGGCRPASIVEVNLWQALQAGRASLAANAVSEPVAYCFAEELQSATENGDVFDAWTKESTGAMPLYAHPSPPEWGEPLHITHGPLMRHAAPTQAQAGAVPLTVDEIEQLIAQWSYELHGDRARYLVRMTEKHHGIKEGGQHG